MTEHFVTAVRPDGSRQTVGWRDLGKVTLWFKLKRWLHPECYRYRSRWDPLFELAFQGEVDHWEIPPATIVYITSEPTGMMMPRGDILAPDVWNLFHPVKLSLPG